MNRLSCRRQKWLISLAVVTFCFSLPTSVNAADGQLIIDNEKIYESDDSKKSNNSAMTFLPDIFMPERTTVADKQRTESAQFGADTRKSAFESTNRNKQKTLKGANAVLFKKKIVNIPAVGKETTDQELAPWLLWTGIGLIGLVALGGGVILGHRFSGITKERRVHQPDERNSG